MSEDSFYHDGMRRLQDIRETRPIADRLEEKIVHSHLTADDQAFIQRCSMVFVATADDKGRPDCSYKGGLPGFVRAIDKQTLILPDYDGNGMYRTWGNLLVNPCVGLLFIDFENQSRLRVNGTAKISPDDPLRNEYAGSVFIIRMKVERIFPACPRYIHKMNLVSYSEYVPKNEYEPPVPAWKKFDEFRDALPERDRVNETKDKEPNQSTEP